MLEFIAIISICLILFVIVKYFIEILLPFIVIGILIASILYLLKIYVFDIYIDDFISIIIIIGIIGIFILSINFLIKIFFHNFHSKIKQYIENTIIEIKTQIKIEQEKQKSKGDINMSKIITVTEVGKMFNLSSKQMNNVFKELGWIEKLDKGWSVIDEGKKNGAVSSNYMGTPSVRWNENIKENEKLKAFFKPKEELKKKTTYKEKVKKGRDYEVFVENHYRNLGCIIIPNGELKGRADNSIDVIALNKDEIFLIQCKNWKKDSKYKINHEKIKAFVGDSHIFVEENKEYKNYKIKRIFVVSNEVFDNSALKYIEEHKEMIDCVCLPME